jgi:hypothetical protein
MLSAAGGTWLVLPGPSRAGYRLHAWMLALQRRGQRRLSGWLRRRRRGNRAFPNLPHGHPKRVMSGHPARVNLPHGSRYAHAWGDQ